MGTAKIFEVVDPAVAPDGALATPGAVDSSATVPRPFSAAVLPPSLFGMSNAHTGRETDRTAR